MTVEERTKLIRGTERAIMDSWLDQHVKCRTCHDAGFVRKDAPYNAGDSDTLNPEFGKTEPCPRCRRSNAPLAIGVPENLRGATFDSFVISRNPKMRKAVEACSVVASGQVWCGLLMGSYGVGKTHLAVAALHASSHPKPGMFWLYADLLQFFRDAMFNRDPDLQRGEEELLETYRKAPSMLVLDDIGAGTPDSNFTERILWSIVSARHSAQLPTVMTTNDPANLDPRILSRCRDGVVVCEGIDQRGKR